MFTSLPQVLGGKINALAVTSSERVPKLPDIPTVKEAGFPKLENTFWLGVVAPAGTPVPVIDKLNAAFRDALAQPEAKTRLGNLGASVKVSSPAEFGKFLSAERELWKGVVQAANIKVK